MAVAKAAANIIGYPGLATGNATGRGESVPENLSIKKHFFGHGSYHHKQDDFNDDIENQKYCQLFIVILTARNNLTKKETGGYVHLKLSGFELQRFIFTSETKFSV